MKLDEFKNKTFAMAKDKGFDAVELYNQSANQVQIKVFQGQVDDFARADTGGYSFRGLFNGRMGYAFTEILDGEAVSMVVEDAKANALIIDETEQSPIFGGSEKYPQYDGYSPELAAVSTEDQIDFTRELEAKALAADKRVKTVSNCAFVYGESKTGLVNSRRLELSQKGNGCYCWLSVVVVDQGETRSAFKFKSERDFAALDANALAEEAVGEAIGQLGANSVASGAYPVILRNQAAASLLAAFAGIFSAENVHKNFSLLKGKLGRQIANSQITIIDDPLLPDGLYSTPFDAEGVAARRKAIVNDGTLETYLHNLKSAARDKVESTGNAVKHSYKSEVSVAPTNLFFQNGGAGFDQLVQTLDSGLIITELQGTHAGTNPVSGDFSLAANGYLVNKGEIVSPVDQITVAGNFLEMFHNVEAVGNDLDFGLPGGSMIGSPSLLINGLAIAGK
ncbi:MAG: TldD/PmbA family protein [Firmicutes bacterium]|nr:TldD/PmbA family protein [Bacillota bacterium]